jgi:hypothetical protein
MTRQKTDWRTPDTNDAPVGIPHRATTRIPRPTPSVFRRDASEDPGPKDPDDEDDEGEGEEHGLVCYEFCYFYDVSFIHRE